MDILFVGVVLSLSRDGFPRVPPRDYRVSSRDLRGLEAFAFISSPSPGDFGASFSISGRGYSNAGGVAFLP